MKYYFKFFYWIIIIIFFTVSVSCDKKKGTSENNSPEKDKIIYEHEINAEIQIPQGVSGSVSSDIDPSSTIFDEPVHPAGKVFYLKIGDMPIALKNTELKNGILPTEEYGEIEILLLGHKDGEPVFELRAAQHQIEYLKKKIVKYLSDKEGLFSAIIDNDIPKLKTLIDSRANLDVRSVDDITLLIAATVMGRGQAVQTLIDANADVNATDNQGWTALIHFAQTNDSPKVAEALIKAKADINARSNDGLTALIMAAMKGNMSLVKTLVEKGADLNVTAEIEGVRFTALYAAESGGYKEIAEFLKKSGAK